MQCTGHARIHLNTERWRVCETWFSPGMAGVDSAGLGEVLQNVLAGFPDSDKGRLVKVSIILIQIVSRTNCCLERLRHRLPIPSTWTDPATAKYTSANPASGNAT